MMSKSLYVHRGVGDRERPGGTRGGDGVHHVRVGFPGRQTAVARERRGVEMVAADAVADDATSPLLGDGQTETRGSSNVSTSVSTGRPGGRCCNP